MLYYSTRDPKKTKKYTAAEIIKQGLADDGGLFIPESVPALSKDEIIALCSDSYPVRAATVLSKFLSDYTYEELLWFIKEILFNEEIVLIYFLNVWFRKPSHCT